MRIKITRTNRRLRCPVCGSVDFIPMGDGHRRVWCDLCGHVLEFHASADIISVGRGEEREERDDG